MQFLERLKKKHYVQWMLSFCISLSCLGYIIFRGVQNPNFNETYFNNKIARIDITPIKGKNLKLSTDIDAQVLYPRWAKKDSGQGMVINIPITKTWQNFIINLKSSENGDVSLALRGPDKRLDKRRLQIQVNFRNLKIDGQSENIPNDSIWYENSFKKIIDVTKGKNVSISVDIKAPSLTFWQIIKYNTISPYILFSSFIILLFVVCRIIKYITEFYYSRNSRIDIVMLAVFFCLLFLPMSYISDLDKSEQENRMLAKKP